MHEIHQVPILIEPQRLSDYAVGIFSRAPTKSAIKKAIKKELIYVNGKLASTALFIKGNELIECFAETTGSAKKQFNFDLNVVFEDDYLAIIDKPAGILVSGNMFKTVDSALIQNLQRSSLADACRPRPVHRLDYPTTGLLLIGKTTAGITNLNGLFENKTIQKSYLAISIEEMEPKGQIQELIDGKPAETNYKVLSSVKSERFNYLNLLLLKPKTGRRHQLRKHLAAIGNEILGEREYGKPEFLLKGKGLYLHALSLEFIHPLTNQNFRFQSEIPKRFQKIIGVDFVL
ncbi:MAG: 23S rRNA pseudouridine1911/1915/1917 synthase [Vicingaceae bacterium]|jgi:23S rRNA pseudouridine1911/1915/1917 synthase